MSSTRTSPHDTSAAASPSQMGRFETRWLTAQKNLSVLDQVHGRRPPRGVVLDMDSSVGPTHGEQELSVWNGHYACTCFHPLFVFNHFGDLERCALRPGTCILPTAGSAPSSPNDDGPGLPMAAPGGNISPERRIIRGISAKSLRRGFPSGA